MPVHNRSITETPNYFSQDIDVASPVEIVRILRQADAQIFSGYFHFPGTYDQETLENLTDLAVRAADILSSPKGRVVFSGAGTSGRLAMFAARTFNRFTPPDREPQFRYLMAGGDIALIAAQEGAEDDPQQGIKDLAEASQGADRVLYVGITCGMSAPYIAGQLDDILTRPKDFAVLMGFNPLELARNTPIEGWDKTFKQTAEAVAKAPNAVILNPVVGPEPITGSTRMKSGSATKILLEVLFHAARMIADAGDRKTAAAKAITQLLRAYDEAHRSAYMQAATIAELVGMAGATLCSKGHIYYLGTAGGGAQDDASADSGLLGLVDASECPPTYGADFEDVRGFLLNGWKDLFPAGNVDLSSAGSPYRIGTANFSKEKLPTITSNDLCISLGQFQGRDDLMERVKAAGARTASVTWAGLPPKADLNVRLEGEWHPQLGWGPLQFQVKLVVNAVTTGGHVMAGKVFGNRMVDLRISNNKLFHRTVGIISDLMGVSPEDATEALLRSVYTTDSLTKAQREASIRDYIEQSKSVEKVVPKALLIATGKFTYAQAAEALHKNPVVRAAIEKFVK